MKKFLVTLLVAMLALTAVAFAADADKLDVIGNHTACGGDLVKEPTCRTEGLCLHANGDGTYTTFTIKPIPHEDSKGGVVTTEPTCDTYGVRTFTCTLPLDDEGTKCGYVWTEKIAPTSHPTVEFFLVDPTCTTAGIEVTGCPYCKSYTGLPRTWWKDGSGTKTIDGVKYAYDADCAPRAKSQDPADHTDLSGWLVVSEKDCYNPLLKENLCRACGLTLRVYEEKDGHKMAGKPQAVIVNNPNCETVAIYAYIDTCKNCDYFEALVPDYIDGIDGFVRYSKLVTMTGIDKIAAETAEDVFDETFAGKYNVKNTGKWWVENVGYLLAKQITSSGSGIDLFARGHHVVTEKSKTEITHDDSEAITCKHEGNEKLKPVDDAACLYVEETTYCGVCKTGVAKVVRTALTAPEHTWTAWKEIVAPTEDTNFIGKWSRYCQKCDKFENFIGGVCGTENHLPDAPVLENVVEATYTADGSADEVVYCAVCGEEMSRTEIVLPMLEGINEDGILYEDGKASTATGIVSFGGKDYYLINGKKTESMGATLVGDQWYWMAHGVVQAQAKGAQLYNGAWFYVENGKIDITKSGLIEHDGEKFWVAAGRLTTEYTGLVQNGDQWIMISAGRFAPEYSGVVTYDGTEFVVENGYMVVK